MRHAFVILACMSAILLGLSLAAVIAANVFEDYALCIFIPVCDL